MHVIKLDATDSTNSYLKRLSLAKSLKDFTAVIAKKQTQGRGQMGTIWDSESSKNLTFSVFKDMCDFEIKDSFYISMITALALIKTLQFFSISRLSIKWPNDILSEDYKICGVLIENVIKQNKISNAIIGIGLNVNQLKFENLPKASSLHILTGKTYNLDELAICILKNLEDYFLMLKNGKFKIIMAEYNSHLFRKNKPSTFKNAEGLIFSGFIKGVSKFGHLQVLLEDDIIETYSLKEISLLY